MPRKAGDPPGRPYGKPARSTSVARLAGAKTKGLFPEVQLGSPVPILTLTVACILRTFPLLLPIDIAILRDTISVISNVCSCAGKLT